MNPLVVLFGCTIFTASFLLFLVQPLIGKSILAWYGGTPGVWTTCLLFFQTMLLAGYCYSHLVVFRLRPALQAILHAGLLVATLALLPIAPERISSATAAENPTGEILLVLMLAVGGPYIALSATSPLIQSWLGIAMPNASPYRLYALSNVGSLLALLVYPTVVEPRFSSGVQAAAWSWLYGGFGILTAACALCIFRIRRRQQGPESVDGIYHQNSPGGASLLAGSHSQGATGPHPVAAGEGRGQPPKGIGPQQVIMWLLLAMFASLMLMATTNQICRDIAAVPFLWVLPLSIYLLSFIVCFDHPRWYSRSVFIPLLLACLGLILASNLFHGAPLWVHIGVYSLTLFACCMACHGELFRLKPHPRFLTVYYLMIALGGASGGVLVAIVAPLVFDGFYEFPLGLLASCLVVLVAIQPNVVRSFFGPTNRRLQGLLFGASAATVLVLWLASPESAKRPNRRVIAAERNFYGALRVVQDDSGHPEDARVNMYHGTTNHGSQFLSLDRRGIPTTYYSPHSGIGLAINGHSRRNRGLRLGVIGLGTGTLSAYAGPRDHMSYYEIDPAVVRFAERYFTYLADARRRGADLRIALGDARIVLQRELDQGRLGQYDVLAVDAFSGDAIPVHLLTAECFDIYWRHLKPDGVLAVHVSNRYLDLAPVVQALARRAGKQAVGVMHSPRPSDPSRHPTSARSDWVIVTSNRRVLADPDIQAMARTITSHDPAHLWTDDYSSLFSVLK